MLRLLLHGQPQAVLLLLLRVKTMLSSVFWGNRSFESHSGMLPLAVVGLGALAITPSSRGTLPTSCAAALGAVSLIVLIEFLSGVQGLRTD